MRLTIRRLATLVFLVCLLAIPFFTLNPGGERTERVFVYGTLTNPIVRSLACRCFVNEIQAHLSDYRKAGRLNIAPATGGSVTGEIIIVSAWELAQLDAYERVPERYQRIGVTIDGAPTWVYMRTKE